MDARASRSTGRRQELGFSYEGIEFRASFTIDIRGRMGNRAVRRHFQTVRLEARVFTSEGEDRLRQVVEETEARCPVFNLISDAGVNLESLWISISGPSAPPSRSDTR